MVNIPSARHRGIYIVGRDGRTRSRGQQESVLIKMSPETGLDEILHDVTCYVVTVWRGSASLQTVDGSSRWQNGLILGRVLGLLPALR